MPQASSAFSFNSFHPPEHLSVPYSCDSEIKGTASPTSTINAPSMASPKPSAYELGEHSSISPPPPTSPSLAASPADILIAFIYPLTLLAGSAFSNFSPSPASASSYFSQKRNVFNVYFVKYAWLWTTLVFLLHLKRLRSSSKPKALLRYGLATLWWILVTQWCFGPPITDRTFLVTGGTCQMVNSDPFRAKEEMGTARALVTSATCKLAGGSWNGGHDLSGHVFLLTHASLFLWSEVTPVLSRSGALEGETIGVLALLGLWWWMLLMTGVYFHTWREKLTGLIVALVQWGLLYGWALGSKPAVRTVTGVPGT